MLGIVVIVAAIAGFQRRVQVLKALPASWQIGLEALRHGVDVDHGIDIVMPDGVHLRASLYRPKGGRVPAATLLLRTPYHRLQHRAAFGAAMLFARHGYAVLVQDLRGTGDSEGELLPWRDAAGDGVATLDWITRQPWSTGRVGTFGCSALGETQLVLASRNHPAHAAMIPSGAGGAVGSAAGRHGYFGVFEGGIFQLASGFGWFVDNGAKDPHASPALPFTRSEVLRQLPVAGLVARVRPTPNGYADFLAAPMGDPRWSQWGYLTDQDVSHVPSLSINTWGDQTLGETLALAEQWRARGTIQKVIIAPGKHCDHEDAGTTTDRFGELKIANAAQPWNDWYLAWFDHWLRGRGASVASIPNYRYFMLGEDRWLSSDRWPPAESQRVRWFLSSDGRANSRLGDGRLAPQARPGAAFDEYVYDPADPVPSRGGPVCCTGNPDDKPGPADQADIEARSDVLVYTSEPLANGLRIAGPLSAHLVMSSSAADTDLVARLVHVWPDGHSTSIQEGALRLRYRDGVTRPRLMVPGEQVEADVDMRSIAYMIPRGHRLRLQVTSSSFPRLERNLNTGAARNADETVMAVAINRVHHGAAAPSYLELSVLP